MESDSRLKVGDFLVTAIEFREFPIGKIFVVENVTTGDSESSTSNIKSLVGNDTAVVWSEYPWSHMHRDTTESTFERL